MEFFQDLRHAFRISAKQPLLSFAAMFSLALGIGANAAIFCVVKATLFDPLPYNEPERLVGLWETLPESRGFGTVSVPNFYDWQRQNAVFERLAAYSERSYNLQGQDQPIRVQGAAVTWDLFPLLGVNPLLGRYFSESSRETDELSVLISHSLWTERFGADPNLVGQTVRINGEALTVVGVMPPDFQFPPRREVLLWTPFRFSESERGQRGSHWLRVLGRLKPGVTLEQAQSNMDPIGARLAEQYPDAQEGRGILLRQLQEALVSGSRLALLSLWGAVSLVLLIACANVANLLLARSSTRRREFAIRAALGAGPFRLARQTLAESLLLAVGGGLLGLLLGEWTVAALTGLPGSAVPLGRDLELDWSMFAFCLVAVVTAALLSGFLPAFRTSRADLGESLKARGAAQSQGAGRDRVRSALIVAETALSLIVLVGAGLMVKSFVRLQQVEPGLQPERVLTVRIGLPESRYSESGKALTFYRRLMEEVETLPGIESVGLVSVLPAQNWGINGGFYIKGEPTPPINEAPFAESREVDGDYFQTFRIPLLAGRFLDQGDRSDSRPVVLINQTLARRYFPGEDPLGHQLAGDPRAPEEEWATIVGVVGDVRNAGLRRQTLAEIYSPLEQSPRREMTLVARTALPTDSALNSIRQAVWSLDPEQPIHLAKTMTDVLSSSLARERFNTLLFGIFAGLALLLAVGGVYAVISHSVSQRTQEIGIRMAFGANRNDVFKLVLKEGLRWSLLGSLIGVAGAMLLTRFLESQLFEVTPTDPLTFGAVPLILIFAAVLACLLPGRRAAAVDPLEALRAE